MRMWTSIIYGLKGGLAALLSLFFTQDHIWWTTQPVQGANKYTQHEQYMETDRSCSTYDGRNGVCQSLVECARYFNKLRYLSLSLCPPTPTLHGVCCPRPDMPVKDPVSYAHQHTHKNASIIFPQIEISTEDLNNACEIAIEAFKKRENIERNLVRRNVIAPKGSSSFWHAKLFQTNEKIYLLGSDAILVLLASGSLVQRFTLTKEQVINGLPQYGVTNTIIKDTCPPSYPCLANGHKYRSYDGTCNNLLHGDWGSVGISMRRLIPAYYADGLTIPRYAQSERFLPSARLVSSVVSPSNHAIYENFTLLLMQWGQFLDHDMTHTPISKGTAFADISCCSNGVYRTIKDLHPDCFPIRIPDNDTFYKDYNQGCMEFVRSMAAIRPQCSFGPREQMNQITSYIDASQVYGTSQEEADSLRTKQAGRMRVNNQFGSSLLPKNPLACQSSNEGRVCFKAGDSRVNEQPQLAAMHTIWLRHHNFIAGGLAKLNPGWSDEIVYQEARRIVSAQIQHITYNEFLPIILGRRFTEIYGLLPQSSGYFNGYRDEVDASIINSFSTAAYRFGHSLITDQFNMYGRDGRIKRSLHIGNVQFAPFALYENDGVESLLRGLIRQSPRKFDRYFIEQITTKLFSFSQPFGLDLVALNIQRGRDHGLPPYVKWREYCGLKPATTWYDLKVDMDEQVINDLQSVYENIEDVDLYAGGISEQPLNDSIVGPTFICILAKQFIRLKVGDRYFYENGPNDKYGGDLITFTEAQLNQIRKTSLAHIICLNGGNIGTIQPLAFLQPKHMNERVSCDTFPKIPRFNLQPWKIHRKKPTY